jgi:uncharacterized protein (TIGR03437 family)
MKSIAISAILAFSLAATSPSAFATVINFGPTNQNVTLTGSGLNAQNQPLAVITWGLCSFDGTNTTCTLTAPFTGIGPGGTFSAVLVYAGNGPSPMIATFQNPTTNIFVVSFGPGTRSFVQTLTETNGTKVNFYYADFPVPLLTFPTPVCTGASPCTALQVALTPNATITGVVTGASDLTPYIRTSQGVISADQFGAFSSVSPGTWMEIYGTNLGTILNYTWAGSDFVGTQAPLSLAGTTVTVGGKTAFIDYVNANQVNAQVPYDVGTGAQPVVVTTAGGTSSPYMVNVNSLEPGLLAPSAFNVAAGQYVAALFPDGFTFVLPPGLTSAVPTARAKPGDTILLYGVGFGPVTPSIPAGQIEEQANALQSQFQIFFAGTPAQITYQGLVATFIGLYQFNVVVPNVAASDAVPLTISVGTTAGSQTLIIPVN